MSRPFILGLTGSIGMGKSTTARMFAEAGIPVWDADATVHGLYGPSGAAVAAIGAAFPGTVSDGAVDRARLRQAIRADDTALPRLEAIVHPLVAADRAGFVARHADAPIVVLDIPLMYETGADATMDGVAVVSAPADLQRARVLARPGMTPENFQMILSRQMPDAEKRARADWVIPSDSLDGARAAIMDICDRIMAEKPHA